MVLAHAHSQPVPRELSMDYELVLDHRDDGNVCFHDNIRVVGGYGYRQRLVGSQDVVVIHTHVDALSDGVGGGKL